MKAVRLSTALLVSALFIPVAPAQPSAARNAPVAEATLAANDNFLAVRIDGATPDQAPWSTSGEAKDPAAADQGPMQVNLKFADQTPLKPGMFDSSTAWEDEP